MTAEQTIVAQLETWLASLNLGGGPAEFSIDTPQKIDPQTGEFLQAFILTSKRKLTPIAGEGPPKLEKLPPAPLPLESVKAGD